MYLISLKNSKLFAFKNIGFIDLRQTTFLVYFLTLQGMLNALMIQTQSLLSLDQKEVQE